MLISELKFESCFVREDGKIVEGLKSKHKRRYERCCNIKSVVGVCNVGML